MHIFLLHSSKIKNSHTDTHTHTMHQRSRNLCGGGADQNLDQKALLAVPERQGTCNSAGDGLRFDGTGGPARCFKRLVWLQYGGVTGQWVSNTRTIAPFSAFRLRFGPSPAPSMMLPPLPPAVCSGTLAASLSTVPSLFCRPR